MAPSIDHAALRILVRRQHWAISRRQLLALGFAHDDIAYRVEDRRLFLVFRGVYAVGRNELSRLGWWMAAVLACGAGTVLSHESAAALWGIRPFRLWPIEVTAAGKHSRPGLRVHRSRTLRPGDLTVRDGIPVTSVTRTLMDLAPRLSRSQLERAIGEADRLGLIDPERLREELEVRGREATPLARVLDRRTFRLTRSELERLFLPIAREAGLPLPLTNQVLNGYEVDFYWPDLGLVVETDGLRYHRTPAQQARDIERDQAHTAAGLTPLRFTHEQIAFEKKRVGATVERVAGKLTARSEL